MQSFIRCTGGGTGIRGLTQRFVDSQGEMKKRSERLAVVRQSQNFLPCHRPLPGGAGWPKFHQLEMVTTFTYKPSLVRIDACTFELSW